MIGYLAAALGGALGALARYGVGTALPHPTGGWPWATLLVNLSGCLLIGVLLATIPDWGASDWLRPFLAAGVLGGYTTFSAFGVETVQLAEAGAWAGAAGYVLGSVLGGVLAVAAGLTWGRRMGSVTERARSPIGTAPSGTGPASASEEGP